MKKLGGLLVAALMVLFVAPAFGDAVIDFSTNPAGVGGIFTLLSGGNASGVNIPIGGLLIDGAPQNNGTYTVNGPNAGGGCGTGGLYGCLNYNTVDNVITVSGRVDGLSVPYTATLLNGTFISWVADINGLHMAIGPDTKDATLLSELGIATPPYVFSHYSVSNTTTPGSASVISTDIRNVGVVPEPMTGVLFGLGLVAVGTYLRRRKA